MKTKRWSMVKNCTVVMLIAHPVTVIIFNKSNPASASAVASAFFQHPAACMLFFTSICRCLLSAATWICAWERSLICHHPAFYHDYDLHIQTWWSPCTFLFFWSTTRKRNLAAAKILCQIEMVGDEAGHWSGCSTTTSITPMGNKFYIFEFGDQHNPW